MPIVGKESIKKILGGMPYTAELYWLLRQQGKPISRFSLQHLEKHLPALLEQAQELRENAPQPGKKVFLFANLHYWIEHTALLGISLAAQGHDVTLAYLPFAEWRTSINRFDLRRQNMYARNILEKMDPLVKTVSFISKRAPYMPLTKDLEHSIEQISLFDSQYTLQIEEIDPSSEIYRLRHRRNRDAAQTMLAWFRSERPDVVIIPNGTIMELGICYRVARSLKIPVNTYEFSDQRDRFWIAQNAQVMLQNTDALWEARKEVPIQEKQLEQVRSLMMSRQKASLWKNFSRLWQGTPTKGAEKTKQELGLDERPIVLLATNVLGDSLTLGRQVFTKSMAEWIERTVQYFLARDDAQLIIRVHPGEILTRGVSMVDIINDLSPSLPDHIHLIKPTEKINTYDLVGIADIGLVYTTTVGMEMAMTGIPSIVVGDTHYRERGFTYDPDSYVSYYKLLGAMLLEPEKYRQPREKIELAWKYAYHFFFDFPRPFPWHLVNIWDDYQACDLKTALSEEGVLKYGDSFRYLLGEHLDWTTAKYDE